MHRAVGKVLHGGGADAEEEKQDARIAVLFIYSRIVLRLNRTEEMHVELKNKLDDMNMVRDRVPDRVKVDDLVDHARRILKHEWDVAKYGPFTKSILKLKNILKQHNGG